MRTCRLMVVAAFLLRAVVAGADDPAARAALEAAQSGGGPKSLQAEMVMTLVDAGGKSIERGMQIRRVGKQKQLVWFVRPADMAGTAFLRVAEDGEQKLWLYLPSYKKLERIGGAKENRPFLGSDFAFADFADRRLEAFDCTWEAPAALASGPAKVVAATLRPGNPDAPYGKVLSYIDDASGRVVREDLFDLKGALVKRKINAKWEAIGDYRIPTTVEMTDLGRNHTTRIELRNLEVDKPIDDAVFSTRNLERLR